MSIKSIITGTALMAIINVVRLLLQLISIPILARFLSPESYGLAAMAMPIILFLVMVSDAGLGMSLIRTDRANSAWDTCFWLSVALGLAVGIGLALVSPELGSLFDEPRLTPIVAALSVIVPMQTLTLVPGAALQQQKMFGTIAATEIVATIVSISTAIVSAYIGLGVWALIWQQIVFYAVRLFLTGVFSPYKPRFVFHIQDASEHLIFGRNLLGVNLVGFVSRSVENLVIGRIQGAGPLGIYAMAFQFARIPFMIVTGPLQYVLYPHVSVLRDDKAKLGALFRLLTRGLATVILPTFGLVAVAREPIFHILLSQKWSQAAPIFLLIAPAAALQPVTAILGTFLVALGRTDVQMRLAGQFAVLWLVGLLLSVRYGVEDVAAAYSICALLFAFWTLCVALPFVVCSGIEYARTLIWPGLLTFGAIATYIKLSGGGPTYEVRDVGLAASLAVAASVVALIAQRRHLMAELQTVKKVQIGNL